MDYRIKIYGYFFLRLLLVFFIFDKFFLKKICKRIIYETYMFNKTQTQGYNNS